MPYGHQIQNTLSSLLLALQHGLDPAVGTDWYQQALAQQDAARQARREERASLTQQLLGFASSGQPVSAAETYLSSLGTAGLVRPRMQDRMQDVLAQAYGVDRSVRPDLPLSMLAEIQGATVSPLAPPAPPPVMDQETMIGAVLPEVSKLISQAVANGYSAAEIRSEIVGDPTLAPLYVADPDLFEKLIEGAVIGRAVG